MKGIILAGGSGTRLKPLTEVVHKHLLPIGNKPMVCYPIEKLVRMGIKDIILVVNDPNYIRVLKDGKQLGTEVTITYIYQEKPAGIAQAVDLCKSFISTEEWFVVALADNIIEEDFKIPYFKKGCIVFLKEVGNPNAYGVVELDKKGELIGAVEKPVNPPSNLALMGLYAFNNKFFRYFETLKPSARGEYEITDIIRKYINDGNAQYIITKGKWYDCGQNLQSYLEISAKFVEKQKGESK
jgi:glucose-1-phosphate thymidylyltransferase